MERTQQSVHVFLEAGPSSHLAVLVGPNRMGGCWTASQWLQRHLTYDTRLGGYVVHIDKDQLADAPRYGADEDPFRDDEYGARVDTYYRITPTS